MADMTNRRLAARKRPYVFCVCTIRTIGIFPANCDKPNGIKNPSTLGDARCFGGARILKCQENKMTWHPGHVCRSSGEVRQVTQLLLDLHEKWFWPCKSFKLYIYSLNMFKLMWALLWAVLWVFAMFKNWLPIYLPCLFDRGNQPSDNLPELLNVGVLLAASSFSHQNQPKISSNTFQPVVFQDFLTFQPLFHRLFSPDLPRKSLELSRAVSDVLQRPWAAPPPSPTCFLPIAKPNLVVKRGKNHSLARGLL